jgi:cytochrome c biogenesis protein CcmG/thiol:disulfide interchange protein DsbE
MLKKRLLYLVPAAVFLVVGVGLAIGLTRDPSELPSALIDRPAPAFELPPIEGLESGGLSRADLEGGGPVLVNVFATWCIPCRVEQPLLERLAEEGVTIYGINYKDPPAQARAWLEELGDPFARIGADRNGRVGIEWGVYGVPETYVVDGDGRIRHRHVGPLQPRDWDQTIRPLLEELQAG